ncbi:MAG: FecR domain-containing protein, partial [Elusimicrobiota bacterium]
MKKLLFSCLLMISFLITGCLKNTKAEMPSKKKSIEPDIEVEISKKNNDITYAEGEVRIYSKKNKKWVDIEKIKKISSGDKIKTGEDSYAELNIDEKEVVMNEQSMIEIVKKDKLINTIYGSLKAKVKELTEQELEIKTPVSVVAVRGTEVAVIYEKEDTAEIEVYEGEVEVGSLGDKSEKIKIDNKEIWVKVEKGKKPQLMGKIESERKLRWLHLEEKKKLYEFNFATTEYQK